MEFIHPGEAGIPAVASRMLGSSWVNSELANVVYPREHKWPALL
jgi:hypothetical protein